MHSPDLLSSIPPSLSEQLKSRTDEVLGRIIRTNLNTQFGQVASGLSDFRFSIVTANRDDDDALSDAFRKTVQLTNYDAYAPFVAKFSEKPCKANEVANLLSPGLPDYLAESSSTSGGFPKTFPKYNCLPKNVSNVESLVNFDPVRKRTRAYIFNLQSERLIDVHTDEDSTAATIHVGCVSVVNQRSILSLHPAQDKEKMGTFILDHASPIAAAFVKKWRSFLLVHALFALTSRSLEIISMVFINTFVDMMRQLDAEFDMIVNCIELGTIPDLEGIEEVRRYLEANISADPERAEELRSLGRPSSSPGWCSLVWPSLHSMSAISSGSFAASVPLAQWYIGPNVNICSRSYGSTECLVGLPYNSLDCNRYKILEANVIELLDFEKGDSINALSQLWEVEVKKKYEIVLTTPDGLWRYRLGDVVEVTGFDPTDGTPIIQFIERRNVIMRFPDIMLSESDLMAAITSIHFTNVVDWTATIDDRSVPTTIGFFIEVAIDQVSDSVSGASDRMLDALVRSNNNVAWALANDLFRKPAIWLVRSGTFNAFRQMKLDEGAGSLGQIKVPSVLPKATYVTWFSDQVVKEL